ncbi:MAG: 50S ribosomal protein L35 [Chloroflexi bacterium]|nr:50S ribosomal protein L35 [Chloroflexota bacterium]
MSKKPKKLKLKTHKATAARFHITGSGKIMRLKGHSSHLRRHKLASVKRQYGNKFPVTGGQAARVKRLLPYGVS